jgi:hypothetical protein
MRFISSLLGRKDKPNTPRGEVALNRLKNAGLLLEMVLQKSIENGRKRL